MITLLCMTNNVCERMAAKKICHSNQIVSIEQSDVKKGLWLWVQKRFVILNKGKCWDTVNAANKQVSHFGWIKMKIARNSIKSFSLWKLIAKLNVPFFILPSSSLIEMIYVAAKAIWQMVVVAHLISISAITSSVTQRKLVIKTTSIQIQMFTR